MMSTRRKPTAARKRANAFIDAIETERFGKSPDAPRSGEALKECVAGYVRVSGGSVTVNLHSPGVWTKAEIKYALMVLKQLGYTATWK